LPFTVAHLLLWASAIRSLASGDITLRPERLICELALPVFSSTKIA
jgi:hypothetical protein